MTISPASLRRNVTLSKRVYAASRLVSARLGIPVSTWYAMIIRESVVKALGHADAHHLGLLDDEIAADAAAKNIKY